VQWYVIGILHQLQLFAVHVIRAITLLSDRVWALERSSPEEQMEDLKADVDRRVEGALATNAELLARIEALENDVRDTRGERLPQLERTVRTIREELAGSSSASPAAPASAPVAQRSQKADVALDYFGFESHFRGTEAEIRDKQRVYVDTFRDPPGPVVDIGCGRGEFLELLRDAGVDAYGVDRHPDMVARCREKDLKAQQGEALDHLRSVAPKSLGGVFSAQMIEHLEIPDVPKLFELAADALAPGGYLVVETINPESLFVFAGAFYVDLGHLRPLHPLTLQFLAEQAGFADIRVDYFTLPPDDLRPQHIEAPESMRAVVDAVNENFRRLDGIVFGPQDYALIARR
jgi:O-antigen chain-terminating methyltransferase